MKICCWTFVMLLLCNNNCCWCSMFNELCTVQQDTALIITCTARRSSNNNTIAFHNVASPQFTTARRVVMQFFNQPILNASAINSLFISSSNDSIKNSTIEELVLSNNNIQQIRANAFNANFAMHLKTLDLSQNLLESIEIGAFDNLHSLAILDLSGNHLEAFSPHSTSYSTTALAGLVMLNLRDNRLSSVEDSGWLCSMPSLQHLSVARNRLTAAALHNLTSLKDCTQKNSSSQLTHLDVHGNMLYALPNSTFQNLNLLFLDLSSTALSAVPRSLPSTLRDLRLSNNNISNIDDNDLVGCCANLNLLVIEHSNVSRIGSNALGNLKFLERAWLSNNRLEVAPSRIPASLHGLFLDNNLIERVGKIEVTEVGSSAQLQHLHLRNNRIARFDNECAFCNLPRLSILDLSENEIEIFSSSENFSNFFALNTRLELLNLSENLIISDGVGDDTNNDTNNDTNSKKIHSNFFGETLERIEHVDFSFCATAPKSTSMSSTTIFQPEQRRQSAAAGVVETPEEEYKEVYYDESNFVLHNREQQQQQRRLIPPPATGALAADRRQASSALLFENLIFKQNVERIDLSYCAPLSNDFLSFASNLSSDSAKKRINTNLLTVSLNGFNFADNKIYADNLFHLVLDNNKFWNISIDLSDTEWNCSNVDVIRRVIEHVRKGGILSSAEGVFAGEDAVSSAAAATTLTCMYPPKLNGLAFTDERVKAHLKSSKDNNNNIRVKNQQLLFPLSTSKPQKKKKTTTKFIYANDKALVDDDFEGDNNVLDADDSANLRYKKWNQQQLSALTDSGADGVSRGGGDGEHKAVSASTVNNSNNMSCEQWQEMLARQYYKIDTLLRQFQLAMRTIHYGNSKQQQQDGQHAWPLNQNISSEQWWSLVNAPSPHDQQQQQHFLLNETALQQQHAHAVRQAAIWAALFVALLLLTCLLTTLMIYCCYYRCLIWVTTSPSAGRRQRRRLKRSTTGTTPGSGSCYKPNTNEDDQEELAQQNNARPTPTRRAIIQFQAPRILSGNDSTAAPPGATAAASRRDERLPSSTSTSSVATASTASAISTSSSVSSETSVTSSVAAAIRKNNNGDVVHYSRYHEQIVSTPSTVFSICDASAAAAHATTNLDHHEMTTGVFPSYSNNSASKLYANSGSGGGGGAAVIVPCPARTSAAAAAAAVPPSQMSRRQQQQQQPWQRVMAESNSIAMQQQQRRPNDLLVYEHF